MQVPYKGLMSANIDSYLFLRQCPSLSWVTSLIDLKTLETGRLPGFSSH